MNLRALFAISFSGLMGPHGPTSTMTQSSPPEPSRSLAEPKHYKIKVCLIGEQGVGKTSLVHRFVSGSFDESYIRTLGMRVSRKRVTLDRPSGSVHADLMVSDIMGNRTFLNLFKEAYFEAIQGVLAVFDVTQRDTLLALEAWISALLDRVGLVPVLTLGNKIDIPGRRETSDAEVAEVLRRYNCPVQYTSAKTGENVEDSFRGLAEAILGGGGGLRR